MAPSADADLLCFDATCAGRRPLAGPPRRSARRCRSANRPFAAPCWKIRRKRMPFIVLLFSLYTIMAVSGSKVISLLSQSPTPRSWLWGRARKSHRHDRAAMLLIRLLETNQERQHVKHGRDVHFHRCNCGVCRCAGAADVSWILGECCFGRSGLGPSGRWLWDCSPSSTSSLTTSSSTQRVTADKERDIERTTRLQFAAGRSSAASVGYRVGGCKV